MLFHHRVVSAPPPFVISHFSILRVFPRLSLYIGIYIYTEQSSRLARGSWIHKSARGACIYSAREETKGGKRNILCCAEVYIHIHTHTHTYTMYTCFFLSLAFSRSMCVCVHANVCSQRATACVSRIYAFIDREWIREKPAERERYTKSARGYASPRFFLALILIRETKRFSLSRALHQRVYTHRKFFKEIVELLLRNERACWWKKEFFFFIF